MEPEYEIIDITFREDYERYMYKCLSPIPFRKYRKRSNYLRDAIPRGFRKKILIYRGEVVGQIEYAPVEVSGYPIHGSGIIVMNCIWVLRRAKGHGFGKILVENMVESEKDASGFATIGLEGHWSPWMKKWQMEKLGFKPLDYIEVKHRFRHVGECFKIYLMWLPGKKGAKLPTWGKQKMLEGVHFCIAHPLYHPQRIKDSSILEFCSL